MKENTGSERQIFLDWVLRTAKVSAKDLQTAALICVLRNWDLDITDERISWGQEVLGYQECGFLMMPYEYNTLAEACALRTLLRRLDEDQDSVVTIVTSPEHLERAILTYAAVFDSKYDPKFQFWPSLVIKTTDKELSKIKEYQAKGDIANYKEGILWLQSQTK